MSWPPILTEHAILTPWRPMHPDDLAELRERAGLGPCEGIECEARHFESNRRELVTAFRPLLATPVRTAPPARAHLDEIRRVMGAG